MKTTILNFQHIINFDLVKNITYHFFSDLILELKEKSRDQTECIIYDVNYSNHFKRYHHHRLVFFCVNRYFSDMFRIASTQKQSFWVTENPYPSCKLIEQGFSLISSKSKFCHHKKRMIFQISKFRISTLENPKTRFSCT